MFGQKVVQEGYRTIMGGVRNEGDESKQQEKNI